MYSRGRADEFLTSVRGRVYLHLQFEYSPSWWESLCGKSIEVAGHMGSPLRKHREMVPGAHSAQSPLYI